jgi:carboxyl-terminal processing protease
MNHKFLITAFALNMSLSFFSYAEDIKPDSEAIEASSAAVEEAIKTDAASALEEPETLPLPLNDLRKFADVFGKIKQDYVEDIDDQTLLNYAIKGMLSGLDPHSSYLEPSAFTDLKESTSGSFGGLGIEVGMENGFVKVIAPIDDTPAQLGGIEAGDLIIELDDTPVKGMSLNQAVEKMRGEVGTKIKLKVVRSGAREPFNMTLTRAEIKTPSVRSMTLGEHYGYLRISQFQAKTGDDFAKGLTRLNDDLEELRGLIIDLRNNPGGVLQASVAVADQMLEEGLIVYTKGRSKIAELSFSATPGDDTNGIPIIVLIDGGSASASEILAGALQDHGRAVIMGTQSFGKGSVQNILPLDEDHALKLTTARYYTPNGRSIQAQGIVPDIEVSRAKLSDKQTQDLYRESDLVGHLSNGGENDESKTEDELNSDELKRIERLEKDFQLQEAINLLKAIDILKIEI